MGEVSTAQAGDILGVSAPTVRKWVRAGVIAGRLLRVGDREVWRLDEDAVAAHAAERAQRAQAQVTLSRLAARVAALEGDGPANERPVEAQGAASAVDALALRAVVAGQAAADAARSSVIKHLLAALNESEVADAHRRAAITAAETALGARLVPDDASTIEAR